jgi:iron complex outermembrane receptor protein
MFNQLSQRKWILSGGVLAFVLRAGLAGATDTKRLSRYSGDLTGATLERLVNVQVTSVSKKETELFSALAAIFVTTQADIRRSGMRSIPELLRMVPGMEAAQIDENHRAISSRGFNDEYANKLLVLIGRHE